MRKSKAIEIDIDEKTKKKFVVKELTVQEIIDLGQNNKLFGADAENQESQEKGLVAELMGFNKSIQEVIEKSCDFKASDLKQLAPSDIKEIYNSWREVNQTFLSFLEKLGVLNIAQEIIAKGTSDFLKTLAI